MINKQVTGENILKHFIRLFSTYGVKGTKNYLNSQKKYEIIRTLIYFAIPLSLFIAGYMTTKTRMNWLTIIAVLGCLPASKSLISCIMFLRFKSCSKETCARLDSCSYELTELYDMVFTTYSKTYNISHMVIKENTICGYTEMKNFTEKEFNEHISHVMKLDGHKNFTIKIFTDLNKYIDRINQLNVLQAEENNTLTIAETLKSVVL